MGDVQEAGAEIRRANRLVRLLCATQARAEAARPDWHVVLAAAFADHGAGAGHDGRRHGSRIRARICDQPLGLGAEFDLLQIVAL